MQGLELAVAFYHERLLPEITETLGQPAIDCIAAGLVGEGSECFGYDDEFSRDHNWGPACCIWLTDADYDTYGTTLTDIYNRAAATEFAGFPPRIDDAMSAGRVGVMRASDFYRRHLGAAARPKTLDDWRRIPEDALATVTNGRVFADAPGKFSALRAALLADYPDDMRYKRLAAAATKTAQAGQYNLPRAVLRGDAVTAATVLATFIDQAQTLVYTLNRRFKPYFKWAQRGMYDLPRAGRETADALLAMTEQYATWRTNDAVAASQSASDRIMQAADAVAAIILAEFKTEGLADPDSDELWLIAHVPTITAHIADPAYAALHPMTV
ncbi:MAG: DUF4037 domain-containing protein [Actinomycetes bacterium]|jgi:hypothetical protein|nr:DUF4037 domain-containing protein [Actinomycetes bacterium]